MVGLFEMACEPAVVITYKELRGVERMIVGGDGWGGGEVRYCEVKW